MKRSNRLVLVLGPLMAVVAFGASPTVGAVTGTAAPTSVQHVAMATAAEDLGLGMLVTMDAPPPADVFAALAIALDDVTNATTVQVLGQSVQVLATTTPTAASPDGPEDPDTGQPIVDERLVILGVAPQLAELFRLAQRDGDLSPLLRSPQDAASADVTTTGVTL